LSHQIASGDRDAKEISMNARANLVTALLALSLIGPAAAGAQIPSDPGPTLVKQPKVHLHTLSASYATLGASARGNWAAYVHGGASKEVAKAIAAAAKTMRTAASSANVCANDAQYRVPC
jgi:hypothetical protein